MKIKRPKIAVLENVKNILTHDSSNTMKRILKSIENVGYIPYYKLLNTSTHSPIPQNRERVYFICVRNDLSNFNVIYPKPSSYSFNLHEFMLDTIDSKYYYGERYKIWDIVKNGVSSHIDTNTIYQYRRTLVRENKTQRCPTLTANMGGGGHNVPILKDDNGIRKLTPRECFSLQGFPSDYEFPLISDSSLYKLAGNAISVPIVYSIASHIILELDKNTNDNKMSDEDMLSRHDLLDLYIHFKNYYMIRKTIYATKLKQHRLPNFPEDVSENMVRLFIGDECTWQTKTGDLSTKYHKIEVKCVNSKGPMSFGPKCTWDKLYILEWVSLEDDEFNIYEIPLKNSDNSIQNLKVSKIQTFGEQCQQGRRPRITLESLKQQLDLNVSFNGTIYDLL